MNIQKQTYQLTLLLYRPFQKIDWNSPGSVVRSLVKNKIVKRDRFFMSHVDIQLIKNNEVIIQAGMRRKENFDFYKKLLLGHYGMELMTEVYPGELVSTKRVQQNIVLAEKQSRLKKIHFQLNEKTFQRLEKYFEEYKNLNYDRYYSGFLSNPFKGEGAGCAAFAISFLKVAGILEEKYISEWSHQIHVSKNLYSKDAPESYINIWGYLFGKNAEWLQTPSEQSYSMTVFDPQLIYDWVEKRSPTNELIFNYVQQAAPQDDYWQYNWP